MGSIQSGINQLLGLSATALRLNPNVVAKAEERRELGKLNKRERLLERQKEQTTEAIYQSEEAQSKAENVKDKTSDAGLKNIMTAISDTESNNLKTYSEIDEEQLKEHLDISKKRFDIDPSKENFEKYFDLRTEVDEFKKLRDAEEKSKNSFQGKGQSRFKRKQGFTIFKEQLKEQGVSEKYIKQNREILKQIYKENK